MTNCDAPNILWITTDRQRRNTLGCYGNPLVTTPNLDRLAAEGVVMEEAWCQSPICAPSRASFLTGRYPRTTRVNRNAQRIPPDEKVISRLLADHGYVCGHAGKYHLAPSCPGIADWCEPRTDDGYSVFDWSMHPPDMPVSQYTAWLVEHGIEFQREPVNGSRYVQFGMDEKTSNTAWVAQRGINFLSVSQQLERPWFFSMNINDPHSPLDPPRRFLEPYLDRLDEMPLPQYTEGELEQKPFYQKIDHHGVYGAGIRHLKEGGKQGGFSAAAMSDDDHRLIAAAYYAMIDHIDYQAGRVVEALEATGQLENTLILFMSDHGEMLGDHGVYFQGPYFYESMMRVPLLMRLPGKIASNIRVPAMVELVDLAPTLLDLAGVPPYEGMQGRSFRRLLEPDAGRSHFRDSVYFEYYRAIPSGRYEPGGGQLTGVRTREFALSVVHGIDDGELYDLRHDPAETCNLWRDPAYLAVKAGMLKLLCDRQAETIDPLPKAEGPY
ncbi:MAG TPA: sulfatase-like hydrolase/transferase [Chthoniobacteraceae bacterium]|nr:sulfatase-like hydrolase/transferase [Chthoniobacteraceae bacterium]